MILRTKLAAVLFLLCTLPLPASGEQYYLYESKAITDGEKGGGKDNGVLVVEVPVEKGDTLYTISRKFSGRGTYYPQILLFNKIENPDMIYAGNTLKVPVTKGENRTKSAPAKVSAVKPKRNSAKGKKAAKPKEVAHVSAKQPPNPAPTAAPATEVSLTDLKATDDANSKKRAEKKKVTPQTPARVKNEKDAAAERVATQAPARDKKDRGGVAGKTGGGQSPDGDTAAGQKLFEKAVSAYRQDDFSTALDLFDRYLADNASSPLAADASLFKAECYLKLSSK